VVVPTYRRPDKARRLLHALEDQQLDEPFEVVLVDDGSGDATAAELERLAGASPLAVTLVRLDRNSGPAAARNPGLKAVRGARVAFVDDDCVPQPGWLAALNAALDDADLVQGRTEADPGQAAQRGPFSRTIEVTRPGA